MKLTKPEQKKVALKQIKELFEQAAKEFSKEPKLSHRYVQIALKIRNKIQVSLTKEQKTHVCKKCHKYLMPGKNCTVRTKNKMILYHCQECGNIRKFA